VAGEASGDSSSRHALGQCLHHGIAAERLVVVQIFVAQSDAVDSLGQHRLHVMDDLVRVPRVRDALRQRLGQANFAIHLTQQQPAGVRGQPAAIEVRRDFASGKTGKSER
jgi:hypothetical protein